MICQVVIFAKLICLNVGGSFFLFCQNYMDTKLFCQTLGDAQMQKKKQARLEMIPVTKKRE